MTSASARRCVLAACGLTLLACAGDVAAPRRPVAVILVQGDRQRAEVATDLPQAIVVRAVDTRQEGVPGVLLEWTSSAGSKVAVGALTDSLGEAHATWTLGTLAGSETLSVKLPGAATVTAAAATITALALPGAPASVSPLSGDEQSGTAGRQLGAPLVARIVDRFGNSVPGARVGWSVEGGSVTDSTVTSDSGGTVSAHWLLPTIVGTYWSTARLGDSTKGPAARFVAHVRPDSAARLAVMSGDGQVGPYGSLLPVPLAVRATDRYGNVVPGDTVHLTASDGAAALLGITDSAGIATAAFRLPDTIGLARTLVWSPGAGSVYVADTSRAVTFTAVAVGGQHVCAISVEGFAYCWGLNGDMQAGLGVPGWPKYITRPMAVRTDQRFSAIAAGNSGTCAVAMDGRLWCWGTEMGTDAYPQAAKGVPYVLDQTLRFTKVTMGNDHRCALATTGVVYCLDDDWRGQAGNGVCCTMVKHPTPVSGATRFIDVAAGSMFTCAISTSHDAYCWGAGNIGQLGAAASSSCATSPSATPCSPAPQLVPAPVHFDSITVGQDHACGLTHDGHSWCWGWNKANMLGTSSLDSILPATKVETPASFTSIASSSTSYTCALDTAAMVECWGFVVQKWLGLPLATCLVPGDSLPSWCGSPAQRLPVAMPFRRITTDDQVICGIGIDATLYCWGWNGSGEVGDGTGIDRTLPTKVLGQPRLP